MSTFTSNFGAMNTGPIGDTYRSFGSEWFNAADVAREDWIRNEQAAENQAARDLFIQERMAQRNYDLSRDYLRNQSSDMVEGLKAAGLNPILAVNNSGMSNLSNPVGGRTSSSNRSSSNANSGALVSGIVGLVAGLLTGGSALAGSFAKIAAAKAPKTIQKIYLGK